MKFSREKDKMRTLSMTKQRKIINLINTYEKKRRQRGHQSKNEEDGERQNTKEGA